MVSFSSTEKIRLATGFFALLVVCASVVGMIELQRVFAMYDRDIDRMTKLLYCDEYVELFVNSSSADVTQPSDCSFQFESCVACTTRIFEGTYFNVPAVVCSNRVRYTQDECKKRAMNLCQIAVDKQIDLAKRAQAPYFISYVCVVIGSILFAIAGVGCLIAGMMSKFSKCIKCSWKTLKDEEMNVK